MCADTIDYRAASAHLVIEHTAGKAQHDVSAAAHLAAVPMRAAYAERYAGPAIVSSLSWASH